MSKRMRKIIVGAVGLMLAGLLPPAAGAQDAPVPAAPQAKTAKTKGVPNKPDPAVTASPADATARYSSGLIAYQAGRYAAAVQSMNAAVASGGLPANLLAKALYYRGAACQQQGKAGQAISDLTSALEFKTGLDDEERADAIRLRSSAYASAGLTQQGQLVAAAPSAAPPVATGSSVVAAGLTTSSVMTGSTSPPPAASFAQDQASSGGLSGLGSVFGNLFTSDPAPKPVMAPASSQTAAPVQAAAPAEVLPWASGTAQPSTQTGSSHASSSQAGAKTAPAKVATAAAAGSFKIQVAAVKSRDEASAIISQIQAAGGVLASSPATVDEATFGAMGKFFRVRLGPYPNAAAAKAPCDALKATGLDCLVTAK